MEEIRSLVCEDFELTKRDEPELIVFPLEKLDNQELDVCIKTNGFPNVSSSMKVIFPIQALVDEKEPIVTEKKVGISRNNNNDSIFREFQTNSLQTQNTKQPLFG